MSAINPKQQQRGWWFTLLCFIFTTIFWGLIIYRTAMKQPLDLFKLAFYICVFLICIRAIFVLYLILRINRRHSRNGKPKYDDTK